jgi:AcrR family transcriptional regulator
MRRVRPELSRAEAPGIREVRKLQTRARVVAAARALFDTTAFDEVTIKMIAEAAGVAAGTVLLNHRSKADLFNEVLIADLERELPMMVAAAEACRGRPLIERLHEVVLVGYRFHAARPDLIRRGLSVSWIRSPEAERVFRALLRGHVALLMRLIEEAVEDGEVAASVDRPVLTGLILDVYHARFRALLYDGRTADEVAGEFTRAMTLALRGWLLS